MARPTLSKLLGVSAFLVFASAASQAQDASPGAASAEAAASSTPAMPAASEPIASAETATLDATGAELTSQAVKEALFPNDECEELKRSGYKCATPMIAPTTIAFGDVVFDTGRATLTERFMQQLKPFAEALRGRDPSRGKVRIEGHTDATGSARTNELLSRRRADAVARYLTGLGVDAQLLETAGLGSRRLKNPSAPGSAQNRRVEFKRAN